MGRLVTEGTWMFRKKEAKQENLGWVHAEQLWEAKLLSYGGQW